jgi:aminoglycoside phosphotransferase (APT) family kinase protein
MPSPPADVPEPDEADVRTLLAAVPDLVGLADLPLTFVARGWDNSVWRVGNDLTARIPVRMEAVPLVQNEAAWGRLVAAPFVEQGAGASLPVRLVTTGPHPYPWLLTEWVHGTLVEHVPVADRGPVAAGIAATLPSVHRSAPPGAPLNPYRGVDLPDLPPVRNDVLDRARVRWGPAADDLLDVHLAGRAAPRWPQPRVWCHGDLHPRNLLLRPPGSHGHGHGPASRLGVLDFGDLTAGDPATDLGVLWLAFDEAEREQCLEQLVPHYDDAVITRARGWAARFVLAVSGAYPEPFEATLAHAVTQLIG